MRVDELQRDLRSARDDQLAADGVAGRQGVDRYVRRARAQRTGLAVVIVLVLVSAGLFLATRGSDEQRVISGPGDVPHYLPDPLPPGPVLYQEFPVAPTVSSPDYSVQWAVWTNDASDTPRAESQMISVSAVALNLSQDTNPLDTKVDDRSVLMSWVDSAGRALSLHAFGPTRDEVALVQPSVAVDIQGRLTMQPPAGYREVARGQQDYAAYGIAASVSDSLIVDPTAPGYVASLEESQFPRSSFSATRAPRSTAWKLATQFELEPTQVRGRLGFRYRMDSQSSSAASRGRPRRSSWRRY